MSKIDQFRRDVARRGLVWSLSEVDYQEALGDRHCHWCRQSLAIALAGYGHALDRVDNERGYERGNVVPSCWACNTERGLLTFDEYTAVWSVRRSTNWKPSSVWPRRFTMPKSRARVPLPPPPPKVPKWREVLAERALQRASGVDPDTGRPCKGIRH